MEHLDETDPKRVVINLDQAATTRVHPEVLSALLPFLEGRYGNPSSVHRAGIEARRALDRAREQVAGTFGVGPEWVVWTSGGTEANNLMIQGVVGGFLSSGTTAHVVTSAVEHPSSLETVRAMGGRDGCDVTILDPDRHGVLEPAWVTDAVTRKTRLVTLIWGNNEIGTVLDAEAIARAVKEKNPRTLVHFDAVQCVGKIPVRLRGAIDAITVSGHKIHAPKGIGALVVQPSVRLQPVMSGGGQECGRRSGTENVAFAVGLARALELAARSGEEIAGMRRLRKRLAEGISASISGVNLNGHPERTLPGVLSVSFDGAVGEVLLHHLEREGIFVSTGSACSEKKNEPSHVLRAIGLSDEHADATLRLSLGRDNTEAEIERVLEVLPRVVDEVRGTIASGS